MTKEEIEAIRKRSEKVADGNPMRDMGALSRMYDSLEDIPKLLAEIERVKNEMAAILAELDYCMAYKHPIEPQQLSAEIYRILYGGDE